MTTPLTNPAASATIPAPETSPSARTVWPAEIAPTDPVVHTEDRATTFRPVEGGSETRSGEMLMVEAYAVLWFILLSWLILVWRRQGYLVKRLGELEAILRKSEDKSKPQ